MASLSSINIIFNVDLKSLSTDLQNSVREIKKWGSAMQDVGKDLTFYVTAPLLAASGASVKFASDMVESQNKVNVAFKDSSSEVERFAKTTLKNFGIAEGSALDMAAGFGDMATSMGLPEAQAAKMSTAMVGLAGDLASFKNKSIAEVTTALNGVFTGETESLKMLGIVMTEANLQAFALSQGITKNTKDMTQAEKVQLRYAYVMAQTTNAQGDFARTGGGAANQTRVLQEGLKELAVQFGTVILPAFIAVVSEINEVIGSLQEMEPAVRNVIVVVAAAAASLGPLIYGLGTAAKAYANFAQMAYQAAAALAANPYTAIAVALGAIAAVTLVATTRFTPLTNAAKAFEEVMKSGTESIAKESAELNKNLSIAKNKLASDEDRAKAVESINALSPEYLGNLTLENINTDKAADAVGRYTQALIKRAQVMAAQEKLIEIEKKLLDLQLKGFEQVKPDLWQQFGNAVKSGGNSIAFAAANTMTMAENFAIENKELTALREKLTGFVVENEKFAASQDKSAQATSDLSKSISGPMSGTIDFYQAQIDGLQKLQTGLVKTSQGYAALGAQIDKIQEKINAIKGIRPEVSSAVPEGFEAQGVSKLNYDPAAGLKGIISGYKTANVELKYQSAEWNATLKEFEETSKQIFESAAVNFAVGFGEILGQLGSGVNIAQSIFNLLITTIAEVAIQLGKAAIEIGVTMIGIQNAFKFPGMAIAAGVALIAVGSMMKNSMKNYAGAFAEGGIVGGSSFTGDKLWARVNSGELILTQDQQKNLMNQISRPMSYDDFSNGSMVVGRTVIKGEDLELILERVEKKNKRTK